MAVLRWLSLAVAASSALALTPEQMLSAPRRSEAIPNPSGTVAIFSSSQYSFKSHESSASWSLLDLKSGKITPLTDDSNVSEVVWLSDKSLLYINGSNADIPGGSELWVSDVSKFGSGYKAASLPAAFSGLKIAATKKGEINFIANAKSYPNGTAYNEELAAKALSTARIYDSIYVRHWDYYLTTAFNAVFSGTLKKGKHSHYVSDGKLKNLVSPVKNAECPYPPNGGASDYDLSADGKWVAFKSKAPDVPQANYTTAYIYLVPHDGSKTAVPVNGPDSAPKGIAGDSNNPAFSPDGKSLAYFQMEEDTYEADRRVTYVYDLSSKEITALATGWDRSPDSLKWVDDETIVVGAEDKGSANLFLIPVDEATDDGFKPKCLTNGKYATAYYLLSKKSLLVTGSTIYTNWYVDLVSLKSKKDGVKTVASAHKIDPELKGLGPDDIDEIWFKGESADIHAWVIYPEGFDKSKKYPLAYLIHGGPQSSWGNSWSSRWNPKVFADQGYVVVAPNPTGSTGFGDELTDAIQNNWGGSPYKDLVKGWEYVRDNLDYVDTARGVAAGASFGGFMVNWIQGSDLGREFQALVTHDGTFVADAKISTEELWFMQREFNGTFWDARDNYRRWDPSAAERILKFATPHLIIHSDLDYRLPVAEGLSLFNVLQERGVPSRFLNFPDENHWVINPENSLVWHQQVLGWLNKYSGVGKENKDAVSLEDTVVPVVNINPPA
ncbi:dipeptidyl peptidase DppV [Aspergillus candidus]|uniref:Dipeptidyl-peptidase V n=1 Tax=Aspergillus candidus TaxID=41067 RepID=A0A2I2F413_ASPCN|nr:putative dipeptidyl-peptidase [Aspergillus candidus]PLB35375.1 putative dipeptidyl-peptidase [Aspergillus candidus]